MASPTQAAPSAESGADYATGTVVELTGGRAELDSILASAAGRKQAVLLQLSAQWCGPCRAMGPVVARLAAQHAGRLVAIKADIEAGAANRALASELGVASLPTFQLYVDRRAQGSVRGANQAGLSDLVDRGLQLAGGAGDARPPLELAAALAAALREVKAGSTPDQFLEASRTLLRFLDNILAHPAEAKYRRVKVNNAAFAAKVGGRLGKENWGDFDRVEKGIDVEAFTVRATWVLGGIIRRHILQSARDSLYH